MGRLGFERRSLVDRLGGLEQRRAVDLDEAGGDGGLRPGAARKETSLNEDDVGALAHKWPGWRKAAAYHAADGRVIPRPRSQARKRVLTRAIMAAYTTSVTPMPVKNLGSGRDRLQGRELGETERQKKHDGRAEARVVAAQVDRLDDVQRGVDEQEIGGEYSPADGGTFHEPEVRGKQNPDADDVDPEDVGKRQDRGRPRGAY